MNSLVESIVYYIVKTFGAVIRRLPVGMALACGRFMGTMAYHFDIKRKSLAYSNLKIAFAASKTPHEIKKITRQLFCNYGQNLIELFRLPLMDNVKFGQYVKVEGREHIDEALKQKKGLILLAMHYGSWELASLATAMMGYPYKVVVKPQKRYSKLNELLNTYRECHGRVVIERGLGTREFIKSLKNNEIVGMVVDQGGRDGLLVPFFNKQASMSVGAIRMGLKLGVPVCFAIIMRQGGPYHRFIIHKPFHLTGTGNTDDDVRANLKQVKQLMEKYIRESPAEYMWFYKIWKYSKEATTVILSDGKTGHLRQSQAVARVLGKALKEREIIPSTRVLEVKYKSPLAYRLMSFLSVFANHYIYFGRLGFMKWFLTPESYRTIMSVNADFIISCGSSVAALNYLLSNEQQAKSIAVLKPGLLNFRRFDLVILPEHDRPKRRRFDNVIYTKGAPNLITPDYLQEQAELLQQRFSHLKTSGLLRIGLLVGGDTRDYMLQEQKVKMVVNQIKEISEEFNTEILAASSRRTSEKVESMLQRELKKFARCKLLILANRNNVAEAVGGILDLSDIVVVSGDSVSMISEAATSGKKTIVFPADTRGLSRPHKHARFIDSLNEQGYILSTSIGDVKKGIYDLMKNKIQTKKISDHDTVLEGIRNVI